MPKTKTVLAEAKPWAVKRGLFGTQAFLKYVILRFTENLNQVSDELIFRGGNLLWVYIGTPRATIDLDLATLKNGVCSRAPARFDPGQRVWVERGHDSQACVDQCSDLAFQKSMKPVGDLDPWGSKELIQKRHGPEAIRLRRMPIRQRISKKVDALKLGHVAEHSDSHAAGHRGLKWAVPHNPKKQLPRWFANRSAPELPRRRFGQPCEWPHVLAFGNGPGPWTPNRFAAWALRGLPHRVRSAHGARAMLPFPGGRCRSIDLVESAGLGGFIRTRGRVDPQSQTRGPRGAKPLGPTPPCLNG